MTIEVLAERAVPGRVLARTLGVDEKTVEEAAASLVVPLETYRCNAGSGTPTSKAGVGCTIAPDNQPDPPPSMFTEIVGYTSLMAESDGPRSPTVHYASAFSAPLARAVQGIVSSCASRQLRGSRLLHRRRLGCCRVRRILLRIRRAFHRDWRPRALP